MKLFIFLSTLFFSSFALAGNEVGGGGYIVTCTSSPSSWEQQTRTSRLLDFFENTTYHLKDPDVNTPTWLYVSGIIERLRTLDPQRADAYHADFLNFSAHFTLSLLDQNWPNDLGHVPTLPSTCHLRRGIYRTHDDSGFHYAVDDVAWNALKSFDQAGLVIHEIVYGHAREDNHQLTSQNARSFTSYLFSRDFTQSTPDTYNKVLTSLGLTTR